MCCDGRISCHVAMDIWFWSTSQNAPVNSHVSPHSLSLVHTTAVLRQHTRKGLCHPASSKRARSPHKQRYLQVPTDGKPAVQTATLTSDKQTNKSARVQRTPAFTTLLPRAVGSEIKICFQTTLLQRAPARTPWWQVMLPGKQPLDITVGRVHFCAGSRQHLTTGTHLQGARMSTPHHRRCAQCHL